MLTQKIKIIAMSLIILLSAITLTSCNIKDNDMQAIIDDAIINTDTVFSDNYSYRFTINGESLFLTDIDSGNWNDKYIEKSITNVMVKKQDGILSWYYHTSVKIGNSIVREIKGYLYYEQEQAYYLSRTYQADELEIEDILVTADESIINSYDYYQHIKNTYLNYDINNIEFKRGVKRIDSNMIIYNIEDILAIDEEEKVKDKPTDVDSVYYWDNIVMVDVNRVCFTIKNGRLSQVEESRERVKNLPHINRLTGVVSYNSIVTEKKDYYFKLKISEVNIPAID